MTPESDKPRILKSDKVGRDVLSRKDRSLIQRRDAPPRLFFDNASPVEISVNRLTPEPNQAPPADRPDLAPDTEISKISDRSANARVPQRNFYGWAELSVRQASQDGRTVRASPLPENQWHADIILPAEAKEKETIRRKHAAKLAGNSVWRPRPIKTAE